MGRWFMDGPLKDNQIELKFEKGKLNQSKVIGISYALKILQLFFDEAAKVLIVVESQIS